MKDWFWTLILKSQALAVGSWPHISLISSPPNTGLDHPHLNLLIETTQNGRVGFAMDLQAHQASRLGQVDQVDYHQSQQPAKASRPLLLYLFSSIMVVVVGLVIATQICFNTRPIVEFLGGFWIVILYIIEIFGLKASKNLKFVNKV